MRTLVWFRGKDLRVADHPALVEAAQGGEVICLFVLDQHFFAAERARELPHRMQFLLESIDSLRSNLQHLGTRLFLAAGRSVDEVPRLARAFRVDRVFAMRWTEPFARRRDERVAAALHVPLQLFEGETLAPPGAVRTNDDRVFSVFTPFSRAHRRMIPIHEPIPAPRSLPPPPRDVHHVDAPLPTLSALSIECNPRLPRGGERAARERLDRFLAARGRSYEKSRDGLDLDATSRLSVDLKFGTLSVRTVWNKAEHALAGKYPAAWERFSTQLLWRDFTHAVLHENPCLIERPRRDEFNAFPWATDNEPGWRAWCEGRTGYPVVDASARQLVQEGFVHNRARMISASFLTKDLCIDYRRGEAHYMKFLVDGDWAQNSFGWQWTTGCGFDAAPYFRVFNPTDQGKKFDSSGEYVRTWVPELRDVPTRWIHEPAKAPVGILTQAGVVLGKTYPNPIVDHAAARRAYLTTMASLPG